MAVVGVVGSGVNASGPGSGLCVSVFEAVRVLNTLCLANKL